MGLSLLDDALRAYIAAKRAVIACHCESFALQSYIPYPLYVSVNSASSHSHFILRGTALYEPLQDPRLATSLLSAQQHLLARTSGAARAAYRKT